MAKTDESNQKKFSNWLQSIQALDNTKKALHDHVLEIWIKRLKSWDKSVRAEIPTFLDCVVNDKIHVNQKKKKWESTCNHRHCATILQNLLNLQQNPGFSIVWNSNLCETIVKVGVESKPEDEGRVDNSENIPRIETTKWPRFLQRLFRTIRNLASSEEDSAEHVNYEDIFEGCKKEHVWCIANMFMQRGNAKSNITSTGPDDTDAAMFFQMMKNCKLFEIENENHLYDDVLLCRNKLHHSANNRVPRADAEAHLKIMTDLLEKFEKVPACKDTITKIEKMRQDTILSISMPDINIRKMAKEVFKLKKSALEVDKETNKDKGFSDDDTKSLLTETINELENTDDPEKQLNETKSRDDYKRENQEMKQRVVVLEVENSSLKLGAEGIAGSEDYEKKIKNPERHFELVTNLLQKSSNNPKIAANIVRLIPVLDQIVEGVSETDKTFREKAKEIAKQEKTDAEVHSDTSYNTGYERKKGHDLVRQLQPSATDVSKPVSDKRNQHVWCVKSTQTYNIKVAGETTSDIFGCCQLPSGQILLTDIGNKRLKKLDARYQVIGVCNLPYNPWDVCYIGNNEAVVSVWNRKLQFVDVAGMTLTRSVGTEHDCKGLACHGTHLYVTDLTIVYMYSTDGIKKRVLYNLPSPRDSCYNEFIAVSDDGSKIYITNWDKLVTIDSSGNHLYTFTNPNLRDLRAVCVDGEGHVFVCDWSSNSILQFSFDGKHELGTVANSSQRKGNLIVRAICFDRRKSILTCAGRSDSVSLLQLK